MRLFSVQPSPPHIDSGSCSPDMNATAGSCKKWICNSIHPVALLAVFGNYANGVAPARSTDFLGQTVDHNAAALSEQ